MKYDITKMTAETLAAARAQFAAEIAAIDAELAKRNDGVPPVVRGAMASGKLIVCRVGD